MRALCASNWNVDEARALAPRVCPGSRLHVSVAAEANSQLQRQTTGTSSLRLWLPAPLQDHQSLNGI